MLSLLIAQVTEFLAQNQGLKVIENNMTASCEKCHTYYRLPVDKFNAGGRNVRCKVCGHRWFQEAENASNAAPVVHEESQPEQVMPPVPSSVLPVAKTVDAVNDFSSVLASVEKTSQENLPPLATDTQAGARITPDQTYLDSKPGGMNPLSFGLCTFFLMLFIILIPAFLAREVLVQSFPALNSFYKALGFHNEVPGEGLKITGLTGEARTIAGVPTLLVSAHLTNIDNQVHDAPKLVARIRKEDQTILKSWLFKMKRDKLPAGEDVPLSLSFRDFPKDSIKDGYRIELTVADE